MALLINSGSWRVYLLLACLVSVNAQAATKVKVVFAEALDPKDSVTSQKFQQEYERAVEIGRELTAKPLAQCGYEIETRISLFGASDPLQAMERGQAAAQDGAWLIVGPRRSNHYLLLVKGAPTVPTVSLMASSDEVGGLGPLHLSMVPSNGAMARGAARESVTWIAEQSLKGREGYVSVVANDCLACKDFAKQFDLAAAAVGITKVEEFQVAGEEPEIAKAVAKIRALKPAFVLVPNYSHLTSFLVASIAPTNPEVFFVGSDGWGALSEGFVENGRRIDGAKGFSVRGNPSLEIGLNSFDVGKLALTKHADATTISSAMTILRIFDGLEKFLCKQTPRSPAEFARSYESQGKRHFLAPWGVNVFVLENQAINYRKSLSLD